MEILGNKGLGRVLKIVLIISFILAIPTIIFLPLLLNHINNHVHSIVIIYPNGILMLMIAYQFIKMFASLEDNNPFCYQNVKLLKKSSLLSIIMSVLWLIDLVFMVTIVHNTYFNYMLVLVFLMILFFGVSIALYILSELIRQATLYKEENDLTI